MNARSILFSVLLLASSQRVFAGDLDWLVGCWESPDKSAKEVWVKERNGDLIGFGVVLEHGEVVFYELLHISSSDDGSATYTAHPSGQQSATFTTVAVAGADVTFSNPSHDYPQEISYKRDGENLFAAISALNGENRQSFNKRRCG